MTLLVRTSNARVYADEMPRVRHGSYHGELAIGPAAAIDIVIDRASGEPEQPGERTAIDSHITGNQVYGTFLDSASIRCTASGVRRRGDSGHKSVEKLARTTPLYGTEVCTV